MEIATWLLAVTLGMAQQGTEVERQVLERRARIHSGDLELTRESIWEASNRAAPNAQPAPSVRRIIFDEEHIRCDEIVGPPPRNKKLPPYREVRCFTPNRQVWYEGARGDDGGLMMLLNVYEKGAHHKTAANAVPDPRLLGLMPMDSYNQVHYESASLLIGRPDRDASSVESVVLDGIDCLKVEYDLKHGAKVRLWIAPERDFNPVRVEIATGDLVDAVTSVIERHAASGVWFPSECRYERRQGGAVTRKETLKIKVNSLNQPIPADTFQLTRMAIPIDTPVILYPSSEPDLVWDGSKIVRKPIRAIPTGRRWGSPATILTMSASLGLATLAAALVWRSVPGKKMGT